jgi:hypothetical protein
MKDCRDYKNFKPCSYFIRKVVLIPNYKDIKDFTKAKACLNYEEK